MNAPRYAPGIEITGAVTPEYAQDPDARSARVRRQAAARVRAAPQRAARAPRRAPGASSTPASCRTSCPRRARSATATGRARRCRPTSRTGASRSPARSTARWSSTRSTRGANVFMADFEDANTPTLGQQDPGPAQPARRDPPHASTTRRPKGKAYQLNEKTATLFVRPRGWHLDEKHVLVDGQPISGGIFDFALYFFHNAKELLARGSGPYFYLPKIESHLEARLWNDVFVMAQDELGIPHGHDQGDGADRDDPRRVRDGRDPVRAARALARASTPAAGTTSSAASRSSAATATSASPTARRSR